MWIESAGVEAHYRSGQWEFGDVRCNRLLVEGQKVVGRQGAAIADPAGGTLVDVEARASIAAVLAAMRAHGLIVG